MKKLIVAEQKFLNKKYFETKNFYGLAQLHKYKIIETAIHSQNKEVVLVEVPRVLKFRPIDKLENF